MSGRIGRRDDSGAVAVFTVILLSSVMIGMSALVVDLGMARDTRRQAQNAADASALAAGNALYSTGLPVVSSAVTAAKSYALQNFGVPLSDWAGCTDAAPLPLTPDTPDTCISFGFTAPGTSATPDSIRVTIPPRAVSTPFARIWGRDNVVVSAIARIQLQPGGAPQCGVCIIGGGNHDLGVGNILAAGANVAFNGTMSANNNNGGITVTAGGRIQLVETTQPAGSYSPLPLLLGQPAVVDPLANISMPNYTSPLLTAKTHSCTEGPGIYASLEGCPSGMAAGLYVLTGSSHISGNGNDIVANGVTLYFTCGTPAAPRVCNANEAGADLDMTGQSGLTITAPTTGPNTGLAMVSDRNNTSSLAFKGNGSLGSTGTIYAINGILDYRGNGAGAVLNTLAVIKDIRLNGQNSVFAFTYTGGANVKIPFTLLNLSQ